MKKSIAVTEKNEMLTSFKQVVLVDTDENLIFFIPLTINSTSFEWQRSKVMQ